jgi:hemoglobin-like flavoprotein
VGPDRVVPPAHVALVTSSFALVMPNGRQATALFCRRLSQTAPQVRERFGDDPVERADDVISAVAGVVSRLDDPDRLQSIASDLATLQAQHGLGAEDLAALGDAMLWTLNTGLGHRFTSEHDAAWHSAYDAFVATMQRCRRSS